MAECQESLHVWGAANQVTFDPAKESLNIISTTCPHGDPFRVLGIEFDNKLQMGLAVHETAIAAGWKMRTIMRT